MLSSVQKQLKEQFSEFRNRKQLCQYYVSFQFPQKQRKMVNWWEQKICLAIQFSNEIYLSPADLQVIFSLDGLKPVFLPDIIDHLCRNQVLQWREKPTSENKDGGGFLGLGRLAGYLWKNNSNQQNTKQKQKILHDTNSKIMSVEYCSKLFKKVALIIQQNLNYNNVQQNSVDYQYIYSIVQNQLRLSEKSMNFIFEELIRRKNMLIQTVNGKNILIYSAVEDNIDNKIWVEVEKNKYVLRSKIQYFDKKIEAKWKQEKEKLLQAKNVVELDKNKARRILQQARMLSKITQQYSNRSKLLKNTLHQLEIQQADKITFETLQRSHDIILKTMVDVNEIDQIVIKNREIQEAQNEVNVNLQKMGGDQDLDAEVSQMLNQLQQGIDRKKMKVEPISEYANTEGKRQKMILN